MTLQNLQRIGKIKDHAPTAAEVQRLLAAIDRNLADAGRRRCRMPQASQGVAQAVACTSCEQTSRTLEAVRMNALTLAK